MWTLLVDILLVVFLAKPKKRTPAIVVIAITAIVLAYTVVTIINKADYVN